MRKARPVALLLALCSLCTAACDSPTEPIVRVPNVRLAVTGKAAESIDGNGRFTLPLPATDGAGPILTPGEAAAFARGYIRAIVGAIPIAGTSSITASLEEAHGRSIAWNDLDLDPRLAYFAQSSYEPLPDSIPASVRRYYGSHYLVPFYVHGVQAVSIGVAAYNPDIWLDAEGRVRKPPISGNEFVPVGVLWDLVSRTPPWPEQAVLSVYKATGARTVEVPMLIKPGERWAPQGARWKLALERPITVERMSDGMHFLVETIYLGSWRGPGRPTDPLDGMYWFIARVEQPQEEEISYRVRNPVTGEFTSHTYTARFRNDIPSSFDEVQPVR